MSTKPNAISGRPNNVRPLLPVAEAAERLAVSTRSVRRWIAEGELRVHRLGRAVRIAEEDLEDWLARTRR